MKHFLEFIFLLLCLFFVNASYNRVTQESIFSRDQLQSKEFLASQKQGQKAKLYQTQLLLSQKNRLPIFDENFFAQESELSISQTLSHINPNNQKNSNHNDLDTTNIIKTSLLENSKKTANSQVEQSPKKEITIKTSKENLFFGPYKETIETQSTGNSEGFTVLLCMVMTFFFIIILKLKDSLSKVMKPFIARSLEPVARDVLILMVILTVILWIDYHFPAFFAVDVSGICLVWSIVGLVWFAYCAILLTICYFYSANIDKKEALVSQQDEILQEYLKLSDILKTEERLSLKDSRAYSNCEANIAYFLLRQNFICPSYLPMQTESFLRSDFKFSEYLTLCIEKAVESLFTFSFFTFFSIALIAICWLILTSYASNTVSFVLFALITPCITMSLLVIKIKFMMTEQKLRSLIGNPHDINLIPLDAPLDAGINLKNHVPLYLSLNLSKKSDEDFSSYFKTKFLNQHEKLFWWGAPKIWLTVFQMLIIGQLTWAVIFYGYYLDGSNLALQLTFAVITSLLLIVNIFLHLPTTFLIYTTITNIEMMKDKELIQTTVANQREAFQQALIKFYRLIKARRRKTLTPEDEESIVLKAFNVTLIHDAFTQINPEDLSIEAQDLPDLAHLCGTNLENDEIAMIKKETLTENNRISIDGILYTVEQNTQEVKIEPFQTSHDVLSKFDPMNQSISIDQLKKTLEDEYGDVLSKDEINSIIHELKYLSVNRSQLDLSDLSLFIRNGIEQRPR